MARNFGFFIPDIEYLADLPGLLQYLREKIVVGRMCVYCDRAFRSVEAVTGHMRDASHCKMRWDEEDGEYDDYYDFTASYLDLPAPLASTAAAAAGAEPVLTGGALLAANNDETAVARLEAAARARSGLAQDGYALKVRGERTVGHRDLAVYYRQRARPARQPQVIGSVIAQYRMLGWDGKGAKRDRRNQMDLADLRQQAKYYMKLGVKQNRIQTNHPRDMTSIQ
jgi:pre-60S factor REI1